MVPQVTVAGGFQRTAKCAAFAQAAQISIVGIPKARRLRRCEAAMFRDSALNMQGDSPTNMVIQWLFNGYWMVVSWLITLQMVVI